MGISKSKSVGWVPTLQDDELFVKPPRFAGISVVCAVVNFALLVVFVTAHFVRLDIFMLATIYPLFSWLLISSVFVAGIISYPKIRYAMLAAWLLSIFAVSDSPQNLIFGLLQLRSVAEAEEVDRGQATIRVISLNCKAESKAILELASLKPDVVLLQESMPAKELRLLVADFFPDYVAVGIRDSILLVRGSASAYTVSESDLKTRYQYCKVLLDNKVEFNVVSLHLVHSPREFDITKIKNWVTFAKLRKQRRDQMTRIYDDVINSVGSGPTIVGGDFNAPAVDPIYDILKDRFHDAWREGGHGWGKTSLNEYPVQRIDQVWITDHFKAKSVVAVESKYSDHRMVVCDLSLQTIPAGNTPIESQRVARVSIR